MSFNESLTYDQWLPPSGEVRIVANGTSRACIDTLFGKSLKSQLALLGFSDMVDCIQTTAQDPGEIDVTYPGPGFGAGSGEMRYESMTKAFVLKYRVTLVP
jgi:hypothetical protein